MADRNFAKEWYEYGIKADDDFFIRFMMHWVAFNWYYSKYGDAYYPCERDSIVKFCDNNIRVLKLFDPFETEAYATLSQKPVRGRNGSDKYRKEENELQKRLMEKNVKALFLTMYQVRCNLFHGSKSPRIERDRELVKASANLLEAYMKVIIEEIPDRDVL